MTEELNPTLQLQMSQFSLTHRHVLTDRLASDPDVEARLDDFARHKGSSKEQVRREAWRYAWDIVPAFNPYFHFRLGYRMARAVIRALSSIIAQTLNIRWPIT
jgi:glycerol-3-phosphate O-acyltransferase